MKEMLRFLHSGDKVKCSSRMKLIYEIEKLQRSQRTETFFTEMFWFDYLFFF
jgi:hypothetical protein